MEIKWLQECEPHTYLAALDYLELVIETSFAEKIVEDIKDAPIVFKKAKDIFRASKLKPLNDDNERVKSNLEKIEKGKKLSPVLLVVFNNQLIIADGFHRASSSAKLGENTLIACKIAYFNTK
jgi:uncharacterized protein (DUF1015 family)